MAQKQKSKEKLITKTVYCRCRYILRVYDSFNWFLKSVLIQK